MTITDPDHLSTIAMNLRAEAVDVDYGAEESHIIADLFDAAASEDFLDFGDTRQVRRYIGQLAEMLEAVMAEEPIR